MAKPRSTPIIIVEGKTDIKIYEKMLKENNLISNIDLQEISYFDEVNGGGCNNILKWIEKEKAFFDQFDNIEERILWIIDGDACEVKKKLGSDEKNIDKYKFLHRLKLYCIESYIFDDECLKNVLRKYLNAREKDIRECLQEPIYSIILQNIFEIGKKLALLCLLNKFSGKDKIVKFKYSISLRDYSNWHKLKNEIDCEYQNNREEIKEIEKKITIENNWTFIKKVVNGKHLISMITLFLKEILSSMTKSKICENKENKEILLQISCTKEEECDKSVCRYKIMGKGTKPKFSGEYSIPFIRADIIEYSNTKELYTELEKSLNKLAM